MRLPAVRHCTKYSTEVKNRCFRQTVLLVSPGELSFKQFRDWNPAFRNLVLGSHSPVNFFPHQIDGFPSHTLYTPRMVQFRLDFLPQNF